MNPVPRGGNGNHCVNEILRGKNGKERRDETEDKILRGLSHQDHLKAIKGTKRLEKYKDLEVSTPFGLWNIKKHNVHSGGHIFRREGWIKEK